VLVGEILACCIERPCSRAISPGLAVGGVGVTLTITLTHDGTTLGKIVNNASVATEADDNPTNDDDPGDVTITPAPVLDLAMTKNLAAAQAASALIGAKVAFSIVVTNPGGIGAAAGTVAVTDSFETADWGVHADTVTNGWTDNGDGTLSYLIPEALAAGNLTGVVLPQVVLVAKRTGASLANNVSAPTTIGTTPDVDPTNNTDDTVVKVTEPPYDLSLTKSLTGTNVSRGSIVTYEFAVTNDASMAALNLVISDPLPAGLTYVTPQTDPNWSVVDGELRYTIARVESGATKTFRLTVKVTALARSPIPPLSRCSATGTRTTTCRRTIPTTPF
jgi:large repetitive protein